VHQASPQPQWKQAPSGGPDTRYCRCCRPPVVNCVALLHFAPNRHVTTLHLTATPHHPGSKHRDWTACSEHTREQGEHALQESMRCSRTAKSRRDSRRLLPWHGRTCYGKASMPSRLCPPCWH
jgi:hypothetical protein